MSKLSRTTSVMDEDRKLVLVNSKAKMYDEIISIMDDIFDDDKNVPHFGMIGEKISERLGYKEPDAPVLIDMSLKPFLSVATKKPIDINYMLYDEFIDYGRGVLGIKETDLPPLYFNLNGYSMTHERDDCYVIETLEGTHNFTPEDVLIIGVKGEVYPCKRDIFALTYNIKK